MKNVYDIKKDKNLNYVFSTSNVCCSAEERIREKMVLVVMHLHYSDSVEKHISYMKNIPDGIDVVITTSDEEVEHALNNCGVCRKSDVRIVRKKNRGRDISSFLVACREEILRYEYFCFVHDKKEKSEVSKSDTSVLVTELWDNLLGSQEYIYNVLDFMEGHEGIGVLVPPLSVGDYQANAFMNTWFKDYEKTEKLLDELGVKADLDPEKPPITLGTVFWARTDALRKLLDKAWKYEDFDEEPLANDGTISHAIERSLAYVAQDAGYDTGWIMTDRCAGEREETMTRLLRNSYELMYTELGIRSPFQVANYVRMKEEMCSFAQRFSELYIFGAGVYGKGCLKMLRNLNIHVESFVVSDGASDKDRQIDGLPVVEIGAVDWSQDCGIIVAVGVTNVKTVVDTIQTSIPGFENYILFAQ